MLLIDPAEAALAIGASCNGAAVPANAQLILVLKYITPRVEDALNVATLERGVFTDSFYLPCMNPRSDRPLARLRLSNGFLLEQGTITVLDEDGEAVATENVDHNHGIVELASWEKGRHSVEYTSGFSYPAIPDPVPEGYDPDARVFENVPMWIRALVSELVVMWYRTSVLSPKVPENVNLRALDEMLRKEIYMRVYGRYERPRFNCIFTDGLSRAN